MKIKDFGAVLVALLLMLSLVGTASAEILVETDVFVIGNGTVSRELSIQSDDEYNGVKYDSDLWTPSLGMYGSSKIFLEERISLILSNCSVLDVNGAFEGEYIKSNSCLRNYAIGTRQSNQYNGNAIVDYQWYASNLSSEMAFAGDFSGKQRYTVLVRNITNRHYKIYDEDFSIRGNATIDLTSAVNQVVCVGSGDWLGCP